MTLKSELESTNGENLISTGSDWQDQTQLKINLISPTESNGILGHTVAASAYIDKVQIGCTIYILQYQFTCPLVALLCNIVVPLF